LFSIPNTVNKHFTIFFTFYSGQTWWSPYMTKASLVFRSSPKTWQETREPNTHFSRFNQLLFIWKKEFYSQINTTPAIWCSFVERNVRTSSIPCISCISIFLFHSEIFESNCTVQCLSTFLSSRTTFCKKNRFGVLFKF
jgi:hypothetical protein